MHFTREQSRSLLEIMVKFSTNVRDIGNRELFNPEDIVGISLAGNVLTLRTMEFRETTLTYSREIQARISCEEVHELRRRGTDAPANRIAVRTDDSQIVIIHLDKLEVVSLREGSPPTVILDYGDNNRKILNFPDRETAEATYASIVGRIFAHSA